MKLNRRKIGGRVVKVESPISRGIRALSGALVVSVIIYSGFNYFKMEDAKLPDEITEFQSEKTDVPNSKDDNTKESNGYKKILKPVSIKERKRYDWEW